MNHVFVHARDVKTITLSDAAYERLKAWKTGGESFSQVVLRVVPKRGTFGDLNESFKALPALTDEQSRMMLDTMAREEE
jgi:predicted CopG family antitoxin